MQKKLKFKDNIRHRAMNMYVDNLLRRKIDREKTAKEEQRAQGKKKPKTSLTAPKLAYAINILRLVLEENNYPAPKINKLLKYDEDANLIQSEKQQGKLME
tara:strand:+ start:711 stop:1013 length:303 start_codon:yes stop_codon:yes gene_type:complete